ncbi:hypothetical protein MIZ03_2417 [Rhodoferax lithotrophicus]|uniref:Lipoprotein n=1 Tax=Rhodoferax lithotrophicus TaxID=2798804 RepID=A0ABM7MMJ2_9BURK|nr:hypothetical protein [Rhodoferax sp. MIZ03]BCO27529.1 hypothetical protein MIZ03_2417 [Rhodoferax sp. MIZ03]
MSKWLIPLCSVAALASVGCDRTPQIVNAMQPTLSTQVTHNGKKIDIAEWKEEVRLFDGRTVIVRRKATAYAGGFPNASRGSDISTEFKYEPMGITWKHEMSDVSIRHPIAFEIFNGVAYLVLYVGDRSLLFCADKPPTQYLAQFLKWSGGAWTEVPQVDFPSDKALLNLSSDYWGHTAKDDAKGLIPWEGKRTGGNDGETVKSFFEGYHRVCSLHQKK